MVANDPWDWTTFDPKGMAGRMYIEDYYTLLHRKYENWKIRFFYVVPIITMGAICCHGNRSSNPTWPKTECNLSLTPLMLQI